MSLTMIMTTRAQHPYNLTELSLYQHRLVSSPRKQIILILFSKKKKKKNLWILSGFFDGILLLSQKNPIARESRAKKSTLAVVTGREKATGPKKASSWKTDNMLS